MNERRSRGVSIFGPLLLVTIGVILLLNTMGTLDWSIWWQLLRLWPILLVAAGLDLLIGRRSILGSVVAAILIIAILGLAVWFVISDTVEVGTYTTEQIRQPLGAATRAQVIVDPGVGVLQIEALPEGANLVEGEVRLSSGERIEQDFSVTGSQATYELRTAERAFGPFNWGWSDRRVWDLGFSPRPTLALEADLGAGEAILDLTGLTLSDLRVDVGLGRLEITLPAEGQLDGKLEGAIGQTLIIVPEGMAVRIQADTGLAGRDIPAGWQQEVDVITSPGYGTAENRTELQGGQAIGLLEVRAGR